MSSESRPRSKKVRPTDLFASEFKRSSGVISGVIGKKSLGGRKDGVGVFTVKNPKGILVKYDPDVYDAKVSDGEVLITPKSAAPES